MRRLIPMFAVVSLLVPAVALAQAGSQNPPPSENEMRDSFVEPWIGFHFSGGLSDAFDAVGTSSHPKAYGVSLGFWQRGVVSGEIEFGYAKNYFGDPDLLGGNNLLTFTGNTMIGPWINLSDQQAIRPYFLVGGGLARSNLGDFTDLTQTNQNRGVIDFGGGVNVYITKAIGVRADVRFMRDFGSNDSAAGFGLTNTTYKRVTFGALFAF